jgi:hypothetical protein
MLPSNYVLTPTLKTTLALPSSSFAAVVSPALLASASVVIVAVVLVVYLVPLLRFPLPPLWRRVQRVILALAAVDSKVLNEAAFYLQLTASQRVQLIGGLLLEPLVRGSKPSGVGLFLEFVVLGLGPHMSNQDTLERRYQELPLKTTRPPRDRTPKIGLHYPNWLVTNRHHSPCQLLAERRYMVARQLKLREGQIKFGLWCMLTRVVPRFGISVQYRLVFSRYFPN